MILFLFLILLTEGKIYTQDIYGGDNWVFFNASKKMKIVDFSKLDCVVLYKPCNLCPLLFVKDLKYFGGIREDGGAYVQAIGIENYRYDGKGTGVRSIFSRLRCTIEFVHKRKLD